MKNSKYQWKWQGKYIYVLAFVLPVITFVIYMACTDVMPFGNNTLLFGDASSQIYPSILECYRMLRDGNSGLFSWNSGLGTNFYIAFAMYMMSPLHWILMVLPVGWLEMALQGIMVFKIALIAVSATYYFMHADVLKGCSHRKKLSLLFALSYAMSSAVLSYFFYVSWLDSYILLPIVLLGLEQLIQKGKWKLYYISLVFTMISYFYMAYGVCLFLVLWFVCKADWKQMKQSFLKFAFVSITAACTAGVVFVPILKAIAIKQKDVFALNNGYYWYEISNVWSFLNRLLPLNELDMYGAGIETFNVYCGCVVLVAAIAYLFFSKERVSERLKLSLLLLVMVMSQLSHGLIYIWHGFSLPHGMCNRFSFCLVFVMAYIAAKGFRCLLKLQWKTILVLGVAFATIFVGSLMFSAEISRPEVYVATMMSIFLIVTILILFKRDSINQKQFVTCLVVLGILEILGTAGWGLSIGRMQNWRETMDYDRFSPVFEELSDSTGRVATQGHQILNPGLLFGKKSTSIFSSLIPASMEQTFEDLGLYTYVHGAVMHYRGNTALTHLLFNVEHTVSEDSNYFTGQTLWRKNEYYVMKTDATVGYGFVTSDALLNVKPESANVFEYQNAIGKALGANSDLFTTVTTETPVFNYETMILTDVSKPNRVDYCNTNLKTMDDENVVIQNVDEAENYQVKEILENGSFEMEITVPQDMENAYIFLQNKDIMYSAVCINMEPILNDLTKQCNQMLFLGELKAGTKIQVYMNSVNTAQAMGTMHYYFAEYHPEVFAELRDNLSKSALNVVRMDANGLEGEVNVDKDGMLYLSVADDGGFTAYVDGEKTHHELFANSMICVPISKGNHSVELRYEVPGLKKGIICSLVGIIMLLSMLYFEKRKNSK